MGGLLFLLAAASQAQSTDPPIRLVLEHTITASAGVAFGLISGLDLGLDGSVAAIDEVNGRIYRFLPTGRLRDSLSRRGGAPGEFLESAGIAIGPAGELVLADLKSRRLTFWSSDGRLLGSGPIEGLPVGVFWRGADPVVAAVVFSDSVSVGFYPVRFGTGQPAGPWIGRFADLPKDKFALAASCASCRHTVAGDGRLIVAAPDTFYRVSEVDPAGGIVRRWSRPDAGASVRFRNRFQGIGVDARGRLLALVNNAGSDLPVLDVFDAGGKLLGSVTPGERLRSLVVRGSRAVALGESAAGKPVIHVYRIEEVP